MSRISETYIVLKNRNKRVKELRAQGYDVSVRTSNNQLIHPQYIDDYVGEEKADTGLGNGVYKTYFKSLYILEAVPA